MKLTRKFMGVGALLVLLVAAFVLPVKALAASDSASIFTVESFTGDYYLTQDSDKRSHMRVSEKIVVNFPPNAPNHGIERAIPKSYDGHTVHFVLSSVKNEKGKNLTYRTYDSNDNTVVRIGDPDKYVAGTTTYVINYDQQDVTKNFNDHSELYWDTNGTEWGHLFGSVTARLHLGSDLAKNYQHHMRCFVGVSGSTEGCGATETKSDSETVLTFTSNRMLYAGENLTFVSSFNKDTFAKYHPTTAETIRTVLIASWFVIGALVFVYMAVLIAKVWRTYGRSPDGKGTIVPEYQAPKNYSVLTASSIIKRKGSDLTAQIMDLAVRGYIKIYETDTKGNWFRTKHSYELELSKTLRALRSEERQLVEIIFGEKPKVGDRVTVELLRSKLYKDTAKLEKSVEAETLVTGYLADRAEIRRKYYWIGGLMLVGGAVTLNPGIAAAGLLVLIVTASFHPLTEKGVEQRDYLKGLEMYMKLAEAERIRYLQSPKGVEKTPVNAKSKKQLLKLYEQLLPYAIIWGIEKEWAKEFAPLYKDQAPTWYVGNWTAFNAAAFASSIGGFTTAGNSTFAPPSSSSSSGFSGGGSSGGGGGGGGGGGW